MVKPYVCVLEPYAKSYTMICILACKRNYVGYLAFYLDMLVDSMGKEKGKGQELNSSLLGPCDGHKFHNLHEQFMV